MNKIKAGIIFGVVAGIVNMVFMMIQELTWDVCISGFFVWVIVGYLVAISKLNLNSIVKGILISFLVQVPVVIRFGWYNSVEFIAVVIVTLVLGGLLGYLIDRFEDN